MNIILLESQEDVIDVENDYNVNEYTYMDHFVLSVCNIFF